MDLRWKIVIPVVIATAVATLSLAGKPASALTASVLMLICLVLVAAVAWLAADFFVQRPLQRLLGQQAEIAPDGAIDGSSPFQQLERLIDQTREAKTSHVNALVQERETLQGMRQALEESEERYALAVRGANDGLWEWDIKSNRMYLSPRWKAMLGFGEDEFPETVDAWKACIFPDDAERFKAALQEHLQGTTSRLESEHRVLHKDGAPRWVMSRATAIRHANGAPYRMLGLDTDTTNFKRIEDVLLHVARGTANTTGEEFFRQMVRHFALALNIRVAFVTRCMDTPPTRMHCIACWDTGQFIDKEYVLAPTPCKKVIEEGVQYFIPDQFEVQFPLSRPPGMRSYLGVPIFGSQRKILGHIVFKDDKKMESSILMDSVYQIFVSRAAVEMERLENERNLLDLAREGGEIPAEQRLKKIVSLLSASKQDGRRGNVGAEFQACYAESRTE